VACFKSWSLALPEVSWTAGQIRTINFRRRQAGWRYAQYRPMNNATEKAIAWVRMLLYVLSPQSPVTGCGLHCCSLGRAWLSYWAFSSWLEVACGKLCSVLHVFLLRPFQFTSLLQLTWCNEDRILSVRWMGQCLCKNSPVWWRHPTISVNMGECGLHIYMLIQDYNALSVWSIKIHVITWSIIKLEKPVILIQLIEKCLICCGTSRFIVPFRWTCPELR
jgi:hypothetical protein